MAVSNRETSSAPKEQDQGSESEENQMLLVAYDYDGDRISLSFMSYFLYNMPEKLSLSAGWPSRTWTVFWCPDYGIHSEGKDQTSSPSMAGAVQEEENGTINERIKDALGLFMPDVSNDILVQFWAPVTVGNRIFLSTLDLPFGLNNNHTAPCLYRKHCMQYRYVADQEERNENNVGPPGRVFHNGLLEYNSYVGDYSIKEYPLRDCAVHYGARGYMALPVFELRGQRCIGVLEVLSFQGRWLCRSDPKFCIKNVPEALKTVGLRASDATMPLILYDMDRKIGALFHEIKAGIEIVCQSHNLPFAQTWRPIGGHRGIFLSKIEGLSYMVNESYESFEDLCRGSLLRKGEGVVGKAFSSFTSCFCEDAARLNTDEYPLALDASQDNLTNCFAMCLRSYHTQYSVFIVEFFQYTTTVCPKPSAFLDSLLCTIKHHFRSFRTASGLEMWEESSVEVLGLADDDKIDPLKICQTTRISPDSA